MSWAYRGLDFLFQSFTTCWGLENFTPLGFSLLSIKDRKGSERSAIMVKCFPDTICYDPIKVYFYSMIWDFLVMSWTCKNHNMWELRNNFNSENRTVRSNLTSYLQEDKWLCRISGGPIILKYFWLCLFIYLKADLGLINESMWIWKFWWLSVCLSLVHTHTPQIRKVLRGLLQTILEVKATVN